MYFIHKSNRFFLYIKLNMEVNMKDSISKFSNERMKSSSVSKKDSSLGGCCCGSDVSDEKSEKEVNKK